MAPFTAGMMAKLSARVTMVQTTKWIGRAGCQSFSTISTSGTTMCPTMNMVK